jgi:rubrerythrin
MGELALGETPHERVLRKLLAAERDAHELLERAAQAAADPDERALFERLARREQETLAELEKEEERIEAEEFVMRALDC